ncbi:MAG: endonuclease/exonuclease/phosphatase family protein [Streptosporangiaceae bacterium]
MVAFRLLSYNVRSLADDRRALARVVRRCAPDVACIQESPRLFRWRSRCAALSSDTGLWIIGGGWPTGLLILGSLRTRVLHVESGWLSVVPRRLQRGLTLAVLEIGGARLVVGDIHLDLYTEGRTRHASEILRVLSRVRGAYDAPAVLAGDVNEETGGPAWGLFTARFRDAYVAAPHGGELTFPARAPRRRIDAIFTDPAIEVRGCGVPDAPGIPRASDHRPVVADLTLHV